MGYKYLEGRSFIKRIEDTCHNKKTFYGTYKFHIMRMYDHGIDDPDQIRTMLNLLYIHGIDAHIICEPRNIINHIN